LRITIHRALAELKLLDKRITKSINEAPLFCLALKNDEKNIGVDIKDTYKKKVQGNLDSIISLINRREQIKSKIMYSNAITKVKIAGKEMTVAEAIEKKNNIQYKKLLLDRLRKDLMVARDQVESLNSKLPDKLESFLEATLGDNPTEAEIRAISELFMSKNKLSLYDPINIEERVEKLEKEIEEFLMEVDFVLSESNSKTTIEIDQ